MARPSHPPPLLGHMLKINGKQKEEEEKGFTPYAFISLHHW
jgi:hypothetical protein